MKEWVYQQDSYLDKVDKQLHNSARNGETTKSAYYAGQHEAIKEVFERVPHTVIRDISDKITYLTKRE